MPDDNQTSQNLQNGRPALGWRVCVTYQKTACGHVVHHAEPVQAVFYADRAVIIPDGPVYIKDLPTDSYFSYIGPVSNCNAASILFENKADAEDYAERQELYLQIHELALRQDTLSKCSTEQLKTLYQILSDPAAAIPSPPTDCNLN